MKGSIIKFSALLLISGCSSGPASTACRIDAECASGLCRGDGTCAPIDAGRPGRDAGDPLTDSGPAQDGGAEPDSGEGEDGGRVDAGPLPGCQPNGDGEIEFAEMPIEAGQVARLRISDAISPFDSRPECQGDDCGWDLVDVGGDTVEADVTSGSVVGTWFADETAFAGATHTASLGQFEIPFVCAQEQIGVYQNDDRGLWLLGIVSREESGGTRLVLDPPVAVLQYPLVESQSWAVDTTARGPLCNSLFDYAIAQTWTSSVDGRGFIETPYGRFADGLRVNTLVERHLGVGITPSSSRTQTFVVECFTTVAQIFSEEGDDASELTRARQVRRLANF